jgi:methyl-accepting chemotaxis protein
MVTPDFQEGRHLSIRFKLLILFSLLFTVVFALAFYWFFQFATALAEADLKRELAAIAETAAEGIDGDAHAALYESQVESGTRPLEDERYFEIAHWLQLIKESQGSVIGQGGEQAFRVTLYSYVRTEAAGVVEFVGSSSALNDPPGGATFRESYTTNPAPDKPNFMIGGLSGMTVNTEVAIQDDWGRWVSAFAPIYDSEGEIVGAVGVDMRETTVIALQNEIRATIVPAFVVTYVVLFAAVWILSVRISRPLQRLSQAAILVADGDYSEEVIPRIEARLPDETTTLSAVFQLMVTKVRAREQRLRQQVKDLRIEVDKTKQSAQVEEITDSEFFQELRQKAHKIRSRHRRDEAS